MARRTRSRTTGLDVLARRMDRLGESMMREVQKELDDIADSAIKAMVQPFHAAIEGGPVAFTKINPGSFRSSVIRAKSNTAVQRGLPTATIAVNKHQSSYLKFHLDNQQGGKEKVRRPGDTGVARRANFIPNDDVLKEAGHQGTTAEGNLHRTTLKSLWSRAQSVKTRNEAQRERDRRRLARLMSSDPSEEELDRFREEKKRKKVKRKAGAKTDVFFGTPRGKPRRRRGYWQRPKDPKGKIRPLVHAEEKSDYGRSSKMQRAWNVGVERGSGDADRRLEKAIERAAAKAATGKR